MGLPERQFYQRLDGGYAAQQEVHRDEISVVDLRSGARLGHRMGSIVAVYHDKTGAGVGLDARSGEVVWRTPSLRPSNMVDGADHWQIARDGTIEIVDLRTGQAEVRGNVPAAIAHELGPRPAAGRRPDLAGA